jgi:autotransporter family porin
VRTPLPPTPTPVTGPRTFRTLPPGAALPSDDQCARDVGADPWEPRPANRTANQSNAWAQGFRLRGSYLASTAPGYEERVTGNFTGTTDQIIRWAACKWGFDEDDVRAQAVIESYWRQSLLADCGYRTQPDTNGCASVGLLAVKGADIPATHPGTWPAAMTSTAFNVDYALAVRRLCYDGKETWMRQFNPAYGAGDLWGCIGRWYSGRWHDAGAETYIQRVRTTLSSRTWATAGF